MSPLLYLKAGAAVAVLAILGWCAFLVHGWHRDSLNLAAAEARTAQIKREADAAIATLQKQRDDADKASKGFRDELREVQDRPVNNRIVRVFVPAAPSQPATGKASSGPDGSAAPSGVVPGPAGETFSRDIGADLRALMGEADRCSAQLRALQSWVTGQ